MHTAKKLIEQGYRRVSNRHRIVARIDDPSWRMRLFMYLKPWADYPEESYMSGGEDFYRRVISKDCIEGVDEKVFKQIPGSGNDSTGYIPVRGRKKK